MDYIESGQIIEKFSTMDIGNFSVDDALIAAKALSNMGEESINGLND